MSRGVLVADGATPAGLDRDVTVLAVVVPRSVPACAVGDRRRHLVTGRARIRRVAGRAAGPIQPGGKAVRFQPPVVVVIVRSDCLMAGGARILLVAKRAV